MDVRWNRIVEHCRASSKRATGGTRTVLWLHFEKYRYSIHWDVSMYSPGPWVLAQNSVKDAKQHIEQMSNRPSSLWQQPQGQLQHRNRRWCCSVAFRFPGPFIDWPHRCNYYVLRTESACAECARCDGGAHLRRILGRAQTLHTWHASMHPAEHASRTFAFLLPFCARPSHSAACTSALQLGTHR